MNFAGLKTKKGSRKIISREPDDLNQHRNSSEQEAILSYRGAEQRSAIHSEQTCQTSLRSRLAMQP